MAFETISVSKRILLLKNDTTLQGLFGGTVRMNKDMAPREPADFYIIFSLMNDHDTNSVGANRVFTSPSIYIEGVGKEKGFDVLGPIMNRVDAILTASDAAVDVDGVRVGKFMRTNVIERADTIDNVRWYFLGGVYDLVAFSR